jgi:hypothetical protein
MARRSGAAGHARSQQPGAELVAREESGTEPAEPISPSTLSWEEPFMLSFIRGLVNQTRMLYSTRS